MKQTNFRNFCKEYSHKLKPGELFQLKAFFGKDNNSPFEEIVKNFDKAISLNFSIALYNKGVFLFENHKFNQAAKCFEECIRTDIEIENSYLHLANCLKNLNKIEKAITILSEAILLFPNCESAYQMRGHFFENSNLPYSSLNDFSQKLKLNQNTSSYNYRGLANLKLKKYSDAITDFSSAINLGYNYLLPFDSQHNRNIIYSHANRCSAYILNGDYTSALSDLNFIEQNDLTQFFDTLYFNYGKIYEKNGDTKNAIISYEKCATKGKLGNILIQQILSSTSQKAQLPLLNRILDQNLFYSVKILNQLISLNKKLNLIDSTTFFDKIKSSLKFLLKNNSTRDQENLKEINPNKIFYMYSSDSTIWNFTNNSSGYTLDGLKNNTIYKKDPLLFNDPFDPYFKKYATVFSNELNIFKITCFTTIEDNLLMWAHYANNHKGICVGYKITLDENTILEKVNYTGLHINSRTFEISSENLKDLNIKDIFFRKHEDWSYENEYRLLHLDISSPFYNKIEIKEIIFGLECDFKLKNKVITHLKNNKNINFFQMVIDDNLSILKKPIKH